LPRICREFSQSGLRLDHLYNRLIVPLDWLDATALRQQWTDAMNAAIKRFGLTEIPETVQTGWEMISAGGCIDFGILGESFQRVIIRRLIDDSDTREHLVSLNTFLASVGPHGISDALIEHNRSMIEKHFNKRQYARQLKAIYTRVGKTPVRHCIDKQVVARAFLSPHYFSLLKWGGIK
jgi:hypothetical protein